MIYDENTNKRHKKTLKGVKKVQIILFVIYNLLFAWYLFIIKFIQAMDTLPTKAAQ